jgi:hypothetical protein
MPATAAIEAVSACVGFVHDHHFRAGPLELGAPALRFDEIRRDDDVRVTLKERFADAAMFFQAVDRRGQRQLGLNMELVAQFALPLRRELRRTEYGDPLDFAAIKQFARDQTGFNRLADADIIGDEDAHRVELEADQQRNELVRAGLHVNTRERSERTGARPEAQFDGVTQQPARAMVTRLARIGQRELRRFDLLQRQIDTGDLIFRAAKRAQHQ